MVNECPFYKRLADYNHPFNGKLKRRRLMGASGCTKHGQWYYLQHDTFRPASCVIPAIYYNYFMDISLHFSRSRSPSDDESFYAPVQAKQQTAYFYVVVGCRVEWIIHPVYSFTCCCCCCCCSVN